MIEGSDSRAAGSKDERRLVAGATKGRQGGEPADKVSAEIARLRAVLPLQLFEQGFG